MKSPALSILAILLGTVSANGANILVNPSFESPAIALPDPAHYLGAIPNWSKTGADSGIYNTNHPNAFAPTYDAIPGVDGNNFAFIDSDQSAVFSQITAQNFVASTYKLSLLVRREANTEGDLVATLTYGGGATPLGGGLSISAGSLNADMNTSGFVEFSTLFTISNVDPAFNQLIGVRVQATNVVTGGGGDDNFEFDLVSVTAVPEPAALTMLTLGGVGLIAVRRRKR